MKHLLTTSSYLSFRGCQNKDNTIPFRGLTQADKLAWHFNKNQTVKECFLSYFCLQDRLQKGKDWKARLTRSLTISGQPFLKGALSPIFLFFMARIQRWDVHGSQFHSKGYGSQKSFIRWSKGPETLSHVLLQCPWAQMIWLFFWLLIDRDDGIQAMAWRERSFQRIKHARPWRYVYGMEGRGMFSLRVTYKDQRK